MHNPNDMAPADPRRRQLIATGLIAAAAVSLPSSAAQAAVERLALTKRENANMSSIATKGGTGHDMDHYTADAAAVVAHLDLRDAIHIGHSTGGGEAARYVGAPWRRSRCQAGTHERRATAHAPTPANPGGLPMKVFDGLREALANNRSWLRPMVSRTTKWRCALR